MSVNTFFLVYFEQKILGQRVLYRRRRGDMITIFKLQKGLVRVDLKELFKPMEFSKTRGHQYRVHKGKAIKQQRLFSFSQRVINSWNSLPNHVVTAPTMDRFKNRLDVHWEQHHYETMEDQNIGEKEQNRSPPLQALPFCEKYIYLILSYLF